MKKRIISTILVILLIATILPTQVYAADSGKIGNLTWKVSDNTLTISGKGAIPDFLEEYPPWYDLAPIEKIVIKDGVTSIGANAFFGCLDEGYLYGTAAANSISIPASVKSIDPSAFMFTFLLENIKVNSSSKYFTVDSQGILYNKDKTELLWIPMMKTGTVKIPKTVQTFYSGALIYALEVEKYVVDPANKKFESDEYGAVYYKGMEELLIVPKAFDGRFEIPESVNKIWEWSFANCYYLEQVVIPEGVTEIPFNTFSVCPGLCVVYIPSTVKSIGENAFYGCESLINLHYNGTQEEWEKVTVAEGNEMLLQCDFIFPCQHPETEQISAANCTDAEVLKCKKCFKEITGAPALGHTEQTVPGKNPTCTEGGISDGVICSVCNALITPQTELSPTGHQGEWTITKPATETEKGIKTRTCTVCGEVETVEYSLYKKGDVNKDGSVDAKDATQILRFVNGKASALDSMDEAERLAIGDVSRDDSIDAKDATQILRYVNGKASMLDNIQ